MAVIAGAAIAGGLGLAGSIGSGIMGSRSARKAQERQLQMDREILEFNKRMFDESRGFGTGDRAGFSMLGGQFRDPYTGQGFESTLAGDIMSAYRQAPSVNELMESGQATQEQLRPAFDAGTQRIGDIFSGDLTDERLGFAQPVMDARTRMAEAEQGGIRQALQEYLTNQTAQRARQGFAGGGTFDANRAIAGLAGANQSAARSRIGAELENALMEQGIRDQGVNLQLGSLDLPINRVQQAAAFETSPAEGIAQFQTRQQQPLGFFRTQPQSFQAPQARQISSIPSTGQHVASAVGQLGQTAGNYFMYRDLQNRADATTDGGGGGGGTQTPSFFNQGFYGPGSGGGGGGAVAETAYTQPTFFADQGTFGPGGY